MVKGRPFSMSAELSHRERQAGIDIFKFQRALFVTDAATANYVRVHNESMIFDKNLPFSEDMMGELFGRQENRKSKVYAKAYVKGAALKLICLVPDQKW